jgi:uncharacterized membrane protein YkvA (DUF1232 family)
MSFENTVSWQPSDSDADRARAERDEASVRKDFWRKARRVASGLPFAEELLSAYYCAFDRNTPTQVKVALVGALAYFVLPFDFVPDMLPFIGFTDDAAVLAGAVKLVSSNITDDHRAAARDALARGLADE